MNKGKMLITGGAGFIGTHLAERFCDQWHVVLVDSFRRDALSLATDLRDHPSVSIVNADILNPGSLSSAFDGIDVVIHAAAIAGVSSYYEAPLHTLQVNILGTVNVLDAAARAGVRRFVQFSTSEIFGPHALWVKEDSPTAIGPVTDRRWVYATSKLAGEHFAMRTAEERGFECTIVRPFNIYGPRQLGEGAVSNFCRAAVTGQALSVQGDGSALRAWCYIEDFVEAVDRIIRSHEAAGRVFNIGNAREIDSTMGLARRVAALVPGTSIRMVPAVKAQVLARIPDITLATEILDYRPTVALDEGLQRTLRWFSQNLSHTSGAIAS